MKHIQVHGPGFRVAFEIGAKGHAVIQRTSKRSANYLGGWTPDAVVSTSRQHAAETLRIARQRSDCRIEFARAAR